MRDISPSLLTPPPGPRSPSGLTVNGRNTARGQGSPGSISHTHTTPCAPRPPAPCTSPASEERRCRLLPGWGLHLGSRLPSVSPPRSLTLLITLLSWSPHPPSPAQCHVPSLNMRPKSVPSAKFFPWAYLSFHQSSQFPFSASFLKIV